MTIRDNQDDIRGPLIFLLYHYYRVGGVLLISTNTRISALVIRLSMV